MEQGEFETPVLFLIFNRPDLSQQVFERIREIKPKQLFVAADGPRATHPDDAQKCADARRVTLNIIDWECEVKTLFRDENLGCGLAVSQAITWFFEQVEMGIILEDDCYPDLSFFRFCEKLLDYYKRHSITSRYPVKAPEIIHKIELNPEEILKDAVDRGTKSIEKAGGSSKFIRKEKA